MPSSSRSSERTLVLAAVFATAVAVAFVLGTRARPPAAVLPASPAGTAESPGPSAASRFLSAAWLGSPPAPAAVAVPAAPKLTPELVDRVTHQARERLEELRATLAARCAPDAGPAARPAKLVVNLTFDAQGREIARGISEDRRARAGRLAACLRGLRDTALSVPPPGVNVGVSVPITLP